MPSRRRCEPSTSGIPIRRPSTAWRSTGASGRTGSGAAPTFISRWPARRLPRGSVDPDRRLRDVAGGQARAALAGGARDRHRLQRDQRPSHRGAQAEVRPRQPRGPSAPRRARRRAGVDASIRSSAPAFSITSRPGRRARGAARRAAAGRGDAPHGVRAARTDRRLHAAGVLPAGRHRRHRRRDSRSGRRAGRAAARSPAGDAAARGAGLPGARRRSPMRCCTRRTAPIRCRSSSSCSTAAGLTFGRWVWQAHYDPHCGVMARIPQAARIAAASRAGAVRRRRAVPGHDASPQRDRVPRRRRRRRAPADQLRRRRAGTATCRFACRTRSASRRGCRRARPRC